MAINPQHARMRHYRMPAEWEPHLATYIVWPHNLETWPGKFEPIPWVYAEIIRNLVKHERVELIVNDAAAARQARRILCRAEALSGNVHVHRWPTNRVWLRDSGCIFLKPLSDGPERLSSHEDREGHEFTRADKADRICGGF